MSLSRRVTHACCSILLLLPLLGCGERVGPWGKVSGTITQDGKPISPAIVLFSNRAAGIEMTAETDADGRFTMRTDRIAGLPIGTYRVAITPRAVNVPPPEQGMMFTNPPLTLDSKIPPQYQDAATTPLSAVVKEGANDDFTFELK